MPDLARVRRQSRKLYRSKGFQGAYVAGAVAALGGRPADTCPYALDRMKTWRQAYRRAWLRGYQSINKEDV